VKFFEKETRYLAVAVLILSLKATNIIAYGETIGSRKLSLPTLKASNKSVRRCYSPSVSDGFVGCIPSDSR